MKYVPPLGEAPNTPYTPVWLRVNTRSGRPAILQKD
jgi:hypothetical protein